MHKRINGIKSLNFLVVMVSAFLTLTLSTVGATTGDTQPCYDGCTGTSVGTLEFTPEGDQVFNYQTNDGFCTDGVNPGGVIMQLCGCSEVAELTEEGIYLLSITINTDGVYFLPPASPATQVDLVFSSYPDELSACDTTIPDENTQGIPATLASGEKVYRSTLPTTLFTAGESYIKVELPSMYYVGDEVTLGSVVNVTLSVIAGDNVCVSCNDAICSCVYDIATVGCMECKTLLQYVLINNKSWWTGVAFTNTNPEQVNATLSLFIDGTLQGVAEIVLSPKAVYAAQVITMFPTVDIVGSGYLVIEATDSLDILCILGTSTGCYGYNGKSCCSWCSR